MLKITRIDWPRLLRELDAIGLSPVAVADHLGIARSAPYRWIEGSEPLHCHGAALLVLYSEKIRHGETAAEQHHPREDVNPKGEKR